MTSRVSASEARVFVSGGTVYQPVTVVTPQGQMMTQALSPGTIRVQNNQVPPMASTLILLKGDRAVGRGSASNRFQSCFWVRAALIAVFWPILI